MFVSNEFKNLHTVNPMSNKEGLHMAYTEKFEKNIEWSSHDFI